MHVFADLQPYLCTFASCDKELAQFTTRAAWAEHEFTEHRIIRSWTCAECSKHCDSEIEWKQHLERSHQHTLFGSLYHIAKDKAYAARAKPIENEECLLCQVVLGKTRREFVKHVGRHMEEIALIVLPREIDEVSEASSTSKEEDLSPYSDMTPINLLPNIDFKQFLQSGTLKNFPSNGEALSKIDPHDATVSATQSLSDPYQFQQSDFLLEDLAAAIQGERGIRIMNRRWHLKLYRKCFIGSELTTWLLQNFKDINTRDEAVMLGDDLHQAGLFKHIERSQQFKDGNFFYQIADKYLEYGLGSSSTDEYWHPEIWPKSTTFSDLKFAPAPDSTHFYYDRFSVVGEPAAIVIDDDGKERTRCPHPDCGRPFKDLKAHMLTHQSDRPEKCPIATCIYHQKGFARKYDRNRHTLTHYKGILVCGFCPGSGSSLEKSFNRADVFKRHLFSVHGVEQTSPYSRRRSTTSSVAKKASTQATCDTLGRCSTCSVRFVNAQDFYEHLDDCVIRAVQQEEPTEAVNERNLGEFASDSVIGEKGKGDVVSSTTQDQLP